MRISDWRSDVCSSDLADRGGATCWGITEAVARAEGYADAMRDLPRADAASIYRRLYWLRPGFDKVALRASKIAAELFDTGVNKIGRSSCRERLCQYG